MEGPETGNNITKRVNEHGYEGQQLGGTDAESRRRGSMTGIMSRDLFSGVALAIGGTITTAVRFLTLAVRETAADVKETMRQMIALYITQTG